MVARPQSTTADLSDTVFDKSNLTNFSDAVIAIAVTLLVLELRLPVETGYNIDTEFISLLYNELSVIVSYLVGFFVIASLWFAYHRFMKYVVRLDGLLVAINLLFVFFIAFLPFPTSVLGQYPESPAVVIFYALNITCVSFIFYLMRRIALKNGVLAPGTDPKTINSMNRQSLVNWMIQVRERVREAQSNVTDH
jgi:uncharacterized membrane protein